MEMANRVSGLTINGGCSSNWQRYSGLEVACIHNMGDFKGVSLQPETFWAPNRPGPQKVPCFCCITGIL